MEPRSIVVAAMLILASARAAVGATQGPILALDHAYVLVPPGAAAAVQALRQVGIVIDSETVRHDGEGTTSMGAFFENAYLPALPVILSR